MGSTTELAILVHKRCQMLQQLRDLGVRQGSLIERGDTTALLRLLGVKQQVLAGLQHTERELAPYHEEDPDARQWNSPQDRADCASEASQCQSLLREVLDIERQHERLMLARRDLTANQLRQVEAAAEATGAYRAQTRLPAKEVAEHSRTLLATSRTPLDLTS